MLSDLIEEYGVAIMGVVATSVVIAGVTALFHGYVTDAVFHFFGTLFG